MRKGNVVKLRRKQAVKTDSVATHLKEGRRKKPTTICNIDGDRCIVPKNSESSFLPQSQCQPKSPSRQGVRNVYRNRRRRSQSERDYDHLNLHTIRTRYIYRYLYFTVYGLFIGLSLFLWYILSSSLSMAITTTDTLWFVLLNVFHSVLDDGFTLSYCSVRFFPSFFL